MILRKKVFVLGIFILFISICGAYAISHEQIINGIPVIFDDTDESGCCSVVLQEEGNSSILSYRRDANLSADIFIEQVDWHGHQAIKQYKTEYGYFNHVIVTNDGWIIGLGGIDDGEDNERCEEIASEMISDDYSISESKLQEVQEIKKPYGRGHIIVKAPNGNYGFATDDTLETGKLEPGEYISMPNRYKYSDSGNISLNSSNKITQMVELGMSDVFGLNRRDIFVYDFNAGVNNNTTDIYLSNDDGSYVDRDNRDCYDDVHYNGTVYKGSELPLGPKYQKIGSVVYEGPHTAANKMAILFGIVAFVLFVAILFFFIYRFVKFIRRR